MSAFFRSAGTDMAEILPGGPSPPIAVPGAGRDCTRWDGSRYAQALQFEPTHPTTRIFRMQPTRPRDVSTTLAVGPIAAPVEAPEGSGLAPPLGRGHALTSPAEVTRSFCSRSPGPAG